MWKFFYSMHAVSVGLFVVAKGVLRNNGAKLMKKPLGVLLFTMSIWSIVLVVMSAINVHGAPKGDQDPGGDAPEFNDREEKVLELSGATLCMCSALYHIALLKYCL